MSKGTTTATESVIRRLSKLLDAITDEQDRLLDVMARIERGHTDDRGFDQVPQWRKASEQFDRLEAYNDSIANALELGRIRHLMSGSIRDHVRAIKGDEE